jgi:hypothetical protein
MSKKTAQEKLDALVEYMDRETQGLSTLAGKWRSAKQAAGVTSLSSLPNGVYLPYAGSEDYGTPNVWLHMKGGWITLPNVAGAETSVLEPDRVQKALDDGTLYYLGTGMPHQVVKP